MHSDTDGFEPDGSGLADGWPAIVAAVRDLGGRLPAAQPGAMRRPATAVTIERELEAALTDVIDRSFGRPAILAEEHFARTGDYLRRPSGADELVFTVDPLDGTRSFTAGSPLYAVTVAAWHRGEPLTGLVYQPAGGRLFLAARGRGARLDGRSLVRPAVPAPRRAAVRSGAADLPEVALVAARLAAEGYALENMECTALKFCMLATGERAGVIKALREQAGVLCTWGTAAGWLIATESGFKGVDLRGGPWRWTPGPVAMGDEHFAATVRGDITEAGS